jgi:hypothetical protein
MSSSTGSLIPSTCARCKAFSRRQLLWRMPLILASLACSFGLRAHSAVGPAHLQSSATTTSAAKSQDQSPDRPKSQPGEDLSGKTPDELAVYIFEHHHCNTCHTMGTGGKLGFNDRGKEVGKNFEGCISLLTSMNVIAQVKPVNRSAEEKHKAERFQQFGCTTCHQIVPGKLGLTDYGAKLKSMHMACTDVEKILAK